MSVKGDRPRASSPAATGGAGTFFEQHAVAYWLAQLLVRATPPILLDCAVASVHLQTEHLGWHTDDFLVVGQRGSGGQRSLAGQVKRTFAVSASDEECRKAVQDFWRDLQASGPFSAADDRFVLITQRGSNTLLEHFAGLLDCARAARDGTEFEHRLGVDGFLSKKAVHYCNEIRTIVGELEGRPMAAAEIWPLLRVLHVVSLDLDTSTRQHETMIRTLLAYTTSEPDALGVAEATWNALLALASQGMEAARSFEWSDLPEVLRQRHTPLGGTEQRTLRALSDHRDLILRGIRSTIGPDFHLGRSGIVQEVIESLQSQQVVLVSGPAGSGKSAIAKDAVARLTGDYFTFSFRAEEFAQPHFDATLQSAQVPANGSTLGAILASQDRKIVLVESVERLLEKSTRDAFSDLLTLAASDTSLRILLTCRDYSTDLVRDCFLATAGVSHIVVAVPQLDEAELSEVEAAYPALSRPLASPALRRILRNPYFLDRSLQIAWSPDRPLPESEREFRSLFWQQIVRADQRLADGMPRRREETFEEIALRRARALAVYISSTGLDAAVVDGLRHDSLIGSPENTSALVAPAHDALEDWAILHWLDVQYASRGESFSEMFKSVGSYPAVRRAYRKWVAELLARDPAAAERLFQDAVVDADTPAQFRDDTLVSLLRAPSSPAVLKGHGTQLLANGQFLLRRVIHLLRVACVTAPASMAAVKEHGSLLNIPEGAAWAAVLGFVQENFHAFSPKDALLLLGLIEDWARGIAYWSPYPDGAEAVAAIALRLLPGFAADREDSPGRRIMKVVAKIPLSARKQFEALILGQSDDECDRTSEEFREVIFVGMEGMPAGRDLPDTVIAAAVEYFLCTEDYLNEEQYFGGSIELETTFGIKAELSHGYFPASAFRGPWISLLRSHPRTGLDFYLGVFNHSADWYAHPRAPERIEAPAEIELTFPDGTSRKQWVNWRLWCWYRGTSVGPYALQSLLMAFEHWLLEFAEAHPARLDGVLVEVLRRSENAALTAVVASIGTAFPHLAGEALLVLLSSPACIRLDRQRMATESRVHSRIAGVLPSRAENHIYETERKSADLLPHRQRDLEQAIMKLQFGPLGPRAYEILDRYFAALPPVAEQDDEDRTWRLAMHRMDMRQYTISEVPASEEVPSADAATVGPPARLLRFQPNDPEPDVKEMMEGAAARAGAMNARVGLLMWAYQVFKREDSQQPALWRQRLSEAQSPDAGGNTDAEVPGIGGGPGIVAAVCIRDHWEEMAEAQRDWCLDRACSEVHAHANEWNDFANMQLFDMAADRPCAWALPLLVGKTLTGVQRSHVEEALAAALTHAIDEVKWFAVWGIAEHLWSIDRGIAMRCMNALAMEATAINEARRVEDKKPYQQRRQMGEIRATAGLAVRQAFWKPDGIPPDAYETLDLTGWFGADANARILTILSKVPNDPTAMAGFVRAAQTLVAWWDADADHRRGNRDRERNDRAEAALSQRVQDFVMHTAAASAESVLAPILDAIDRHPGKIHWIIRGLTAAEDGQTNTPQFWFLWELFADRVRTAKWLAGLNDEHPHGGEIISAVFLGSYWKEHVRHWKSLEGYAQRVDQLFEDLPAVRTVLDDYVRFLYHIGERSLPAAFVLIARCLQRGNSHEMLRDTNLVFHIEVLLQRHVYGRPLELKREAAVRDAVLSLLDALVENGSSAAFRMRDDFVTPIATS